MKEVKVWSEEHPVNLSFCSFQNIWWSKMKTWFVFSLSYDGHVNA